MDSFRAFDESADFDLDDEVGGVDEAAIEAPPEIGADERRMHVRAYNYWVSLLDGRPYPSIKDVDPRTLDDFGPNSILLDFTAGDEEPAIAYVGSELRDECLIDPGIRDVNLVPTRSLLSRLTNHYPQIIANRAPIGFEAEFVSQNGVNTMYRGILMPLSSDGDRIDFIYGVINWKEVADQDTISGIAIEANRSAKSSPLEAVPIWADGPSSAPLEDEADGQTDIRGNDLFGLSQTYGRREEDEPTLDLPIDPDAGLADHLCYARESAEELKSADARSRAALYRALGRAYDFALAAEAMPDDYAEILEDAGLTSQARAPMTPVVKLIFGVDYDKARLTEFAAGLSYAHRLAVPQGGFPELLRSSGGLKALVQAERRARRPAPRASTVDSSMAAFRTAAPLGYVDAKAEGEFVLLLARREDDGRLAVLTAVDADRPLLERAIRRSASQPA